MSDEEAEKEGLECLSDKALAQIVERSLEEHDELKGEACSAFWELERRTPKS